MRTSALPTGPAGDRSTDALPLFYDELGYAGLSDIRRHYVGGLLKHAPSLLAFTTPPRTPTIGWYPVSRPR
jgi:Glutamine synthetase, catalytic domain